MSNKTTPPLRGTPPQEGNDSPSPKGWQAQPDGVVPKLRFPEFRDGPSWAGKPMGEVYSFKSNNSLSRDQLNYEHGSVKNIHYGDIHTKFSTLFDVTKEKVPFINPTESLDAFRSENDCVVGDMIFADASEDLEDIGKSIELVRLNGERVVSGQHTILARPNDDSLVIGFGAYLFKSRHVRTQIQKESQGSKVLGISATRLTKIKLPIPSTKPEQQKIAECLCSVDELIAAQARKLGALKTHKKGLMQQLFPIVAGASSSRNSNQTLNAPVNKREQDAPVSKREQDAPVNKREQDAPSTLVPKLRFPEFQNAGEWEVKAIGDVFKVTRGEVLSMTLVKDEESSDAPYPVYSSQTKRSGLAGYFAEYLYQDAITWTTDGANAGDVNFRPGRFYCTNVCGVLINTDGHANVCVAALLNSVTRSHVSYVGNPKLMNGVMAKIEIPFPPIDEQQRIADCLTSLDDLIAAQTQKLDALKTHKQGLMQGLFPSIGGVDSEAGRGG